MRHTCATFLLDQGMTIFKVASPTAANSDGFAARQPEIRDLSQRFTLEPGQNGVLVSIAGQGWCLDAVSRPAVFERIYPKLLAGYVYDAIDPSGEVTPAEVVIERLSRSKTRRAASVALGDDIRFEGKGVIGSGLAVEGELVQLSAYGDRSSR